MNTKIIINNLNNAIELIENQNSIIKKYEKDIKLIDNSNTILKLLNSQKERVIYVVELTTNNKDACKLLGISDRTYYRLLQKYNINDKLIRAMLQNQSYHEDALEKIKHKSRT